MCKLEYHPIIKPIADAYARIIAGILVWRFLKPEEIEQILQNRTTNDRIALASEALKKENKNVTFSIKGSLYPLVTGQVDHHQILSISAQQMLGHCWETLKDNGYAPDFTNPALEFFRHIRNGCFHGNKFHFSGNQPKNKAEWRSFIIDRTLQGKRIFRDSMSNTDYFLNWGDALLLLKDVSEIMKVKDAGI